MWQNLFKVDSGRAEDHRTSEIYEGMRDLSTLLPAIHTRVKHENGEGAGGRLSSRCVHDAIHTPAEAFSCTLTAGAIKAIDAISRWMRLSDPQGL